MKKIIFIFMLLCSCNAYAETIGNIDIFNYLRPDAKFQDGKVNYFSLDTIKETYIGDMPTIEEFNEARDIVQQNYENNLAIEEQKEQEARLQIELNNISNKTYTQIDTYIEENVTDLNSAKSIIKQMARLIAAISKRLDYSE
jgi:hypothetical protein